MSVTALTGSNEFVRPQARDLVRRLTGPRRFIQVVAGPRQVGKTTMVLQVIRQTRVPNHYADADHPSLRSLAWVEQQWETGRLLAGRSGRQGAVLVIDEVQKIPDWSDIVKYLWDEDTRMGRPLKVVLLGSAPLLVQRGLGESLAGRFQSIHLPHWTFGEMQEAFGWSVDEYIYYGAYPGAVPLVERLIEWAPHIRDSLIEPVLGRDILLLSRVHKPALLRQVFDLGCAYSGQILSYTKMLGQLQDAGNTTTVAHYLHLLQGAGLLVGLQKYSGGTLRRRASSPKLQVLNTALISAREGEGLDQARRDQSSWGRLVESAVGAHLANAAAAGECEVFYWRDRNREVDFVVSSGKRLVAIGVRSGGSPATPQGMAAFSAAYRPDRTLLVGGGGIDIGWFLSTPVTDWL